ncbi:O-acetyl-ADP-ribose deacetylase [Fundidesulfovibrio magnetotacticus]|uniref:O-acetyl-ADP-ribose deacetylase n=1 Tax=Fundidesulfovibrio magnetotacticus TaxID=2730080 RepID=A0A6V8LKV8_9BACT|nr:macro domain-containing protein [Fundidesulfovibrio magnetotacticus]GFK93332.1 O-acetyl-ADP-ribose deacetylase [Fundidesulfovibrio magnetotacticus]
MIRFRAGEGLLGLAHADITTFPAEAVVNAANAHLAGGGGVDGAIHQAAGPQLPPACRAIVARRGPLEAGEAEPTPGFALQARYIFHAVGPIWRGGGHGEPQALARAYRSCLELARAHGVRTLAFPAISCGVYGYPVDLAAPLALAELARGLREGLAEEAWMTLYSAQAYETWLGHARRILKD